MTKNHQAPLNTTPNTKYVKSNFTSKSILDKAQGNWPMILESLGVDSSCLKDKHGPCPVCGGKDRFRFDNKKGRGTFICNNKNCGAGDGVKLLKNFYGWSFQEVIDRVARILGETIRPSSGKPQPIIKHLPQALKENLQSEINLINSNKRQNKLISILNETRSIMIDDPVDCYFRARGIKLSRFPAALRLHPNLPYYDDTGVMLGKFPALIAIIQDKNNQIIALHRTYLGNGCKANVATPKKLTPSIRSGALSGAAIRLFNPLDGKLAVAEGIETALSFSIAAELPTWATVSAIGMEKIILPPNVKEIIIAADNDASGRGQEAAHKLKMRLIAEGRSVKIVLPPNVGQDFNDLLLEAGL